jgi:hypothetical protein
MGTSVRRCCLASINACMPRVLVKLEESTVHPPPTHTLSVHAAVCDGCLYTANPIKSNVYALMPMVCARAHTDTQTYTHTHSQARAGAFGRYRGCDGSTAKSGDVNMAAKRVSCVSTRKPSPAALAASAAFIRARRPLPLIGLAATRSARATSRISKCYVTKHSLSQSRHNGAAGCVYANSLSLSLCLFVFMRNGTIA